MSHSVPPQPSDADAARSDFPSAPADRPLPEFQPHDPRTPHSEIEREIERSQRASAALAATRALTRASFTDSELAADDAVNAHGPEHDLDTGSWTRTEYVPFDPTPQDDPAHSPSPRNLVGGSFNPGIASQHGRLFPGASIAHSPIKTRSGAQARFAQESRQAPRGDRMFGATAKAELAQPGDHYDKPAVIPMLAPPVAAPAAAKPRPQRRSSAGEPARFLLAATLGAVVVLVGGGLAWNAGLLSRNNPNNTALVTPAVAAQAEAARVLSTAQDIPIAPAAGVPSERSNADVDAALAAAARAAAVPAASVRAAGPARVARPLTPGAAPAAAAQAASSAFHATPRSKDSVAEAIARAQARADQFLATGAAGSAAAAATKPAE